MGLLGTVATALWAMLPAYVPNNAAVLTGGGRPLDGGRSWRGRRILGDGKTWRGTVGGIAAGILLALALNALRPAVADWIGVSLPAFPPVVLVVLPTGAMLGDILASALKRRLGRHRGVAVPGLDQLDFVVGALGLAAIAAPGWTGRTFTLPVLAVVLVATPVLHLVTNAIAFGLGLKDEPW